MTWPSLFRYNYQTQIEMTFLLIVNATNMIQLLLSIDETVTTRFHETCFSSPSDCHPVLLLRFPASHDRGLPHVVLG